MPLTLEIKRVLYFVALLVIGAQISGAGVQAADANIVVHKKDSKFTGAISGQPAYPGLVGSVELRFVWSGMFKQPNEYYQFIWNHSGSVGYAGATYIRSRFDKYPDLQRRFDQLKPLNVKLSMNVEFGDAINLNCAQGYRAGTGCITSFRKTVTSIPHLMVVRSGKVGDNISPSSPVDNWLGFFETSALSGSPEEVNRKLRDMMLRANKIRISNLRVESYTAPHNQIAALIEEYHRREEEEAEKEEAGDSGDEDDEEGIFDKIKGWFDDDDEDDDFWSGGEDKDDRSGGDDDDFWSGGEDKDDRSGGKPEKGQQSPRAHKKGNIVKRGSQRGVVSESGETLIPFRRWSISSYDNGLAEVMSFDNSPPTLRIPNCGFVASSIREIGYVDHTGDWVKPPRRDWVDTPSPASHPDVKAGKRNTPGIRKCIRDLENKSAQRKAQYGF